MQALSDGNRRAADALLKLHDDAATQRAMVRAWERGDVSTKELATSLRRYNEMDASQRAEFDDMVAIGGSDTVRMASKIDRDTLDTLTSRGCSRRLPSVGAAAAPGTDHQYAVTGVIAQSSGGSCLPSEDKEKLQQGIARAADGDEIDSYQDIDDAVETLEQLDSEGQESAAELVGEFGGEGVTVVNDADALTETVDGFTSDEVEDLLVSYDSYQEAGLDGARSPRAIQDDLNRLATAGDDGVDGIASMIQERTGGGNPKNFKGVDGAAQDATEKLDEGVKPSNLYLERDIKIDKDEKSDVEEETDLNPETDLYEQTDIDVDVEGGSATEIKKTNFEPFAEAGFAYEQRARELSNLWKKLNTIAANGDSGRITITVSRAPDEPISESVLRELRSNNNNINTGTLDTDEISTLRDLADEVESDFGVDITFERFGGGN
ncbi:hypothetical protein [Halomicrobium salinisoli]|uniref:hypothetical protein n=1 Tax=Halomicrobium salinisoli TaxID=2878391 RepID=UPI001CF04D83|nr:hypothetical protein [Halomicrobium salinisoli]